MIFELLVVIDVHRFAHPTQDPSLVVGQRGDPRQVPAPAITSTHTELDLEAGPAAQSRGPRGTPGGEVVLVQQLGPVVPWRIGSDLELFAPGAVAGVDGAVR